MKANYYYLFIFLLFAFQETFGQKSAKIALVIGNNTYATGTKFPKLKNCERDADSVSSVLTELGFQVIKKKNLTRVQTNQAIREFKLMDKDVALIYYSGHGIQDRGRNYIIPVDCEYNIGDRDHLEEFAYNVQDILDYFNKPDRFNKVNILIVDACRNTTFLTRSGLAPTADISGLSIYDNTFVAFSTNAGSEASDNSTSKNGLFTQELLKNIRTPIPISEIMRQTKNMVVSISSGQQIPNFTDNLSIPYYFSNAGSENENYKVVYTPAVKTNSGHSRSGVTGAPSILIIPRQPDIAAISNMLNDPAMRSVIAHLSGILEDKNIYTIEFDFTSSNNVNSDKTSILNKSGADRFIEVDITTGGDGTGANAATVMLKGVTVNGKILFSKRYKSPYFFTDDIATLAIRALKDKDEEIVKLFTM